MQSVLIIGQGIAGTLLAWRLHQRSIQVTIVDDARPGRSSAAAAGLLNPITGRRLTLADRAPELLPVATRFYQELEQHGSHRPLFHPMPILREWQTSEEQTLWQQRRNEPHYLDFGEAIDDAEFPKGALVIRGGGWISYDHLHEIPVKSGIPVRRATLTTHDLDCRTEGVFWQDQRWDAVVFCHGYAPETLAARGLDWNPAAGDILTVRLPGWDASRIRVREWFTIPLGGERYRVGSTYHRDDLSVHPQAHRAEQLCRTIADWTGCQPEILDHRVGIRPSLRRRRPLIGRLPQLPRAYVCNGLGSKGGLWAPWAAWHLTALLLGEASPDPVLRPPAPERPVRLTTLAHQQVRLFLSQGACAIDATAGNGHDTVFLAEMVGESGRIFAFDIQEGAIAKTRRRLEAHGLAHQVTLFAGSHAEVARQLPINRPERFQAVMMNLGYLPAADHAIITQAASTLTFLQSVLPLMDQDAIISVLAYRGHPGGETEHAAVAAWMADQKSGGWQLQRCTGDQPNSPELFLLWRTRSGECHLNVESKTPEH